MSKEAMTLALEALEVATTPFARDRQEVLRAQAALREALAEQPAQQEPVTPCSHPSLGACSLREDGTASRWNCVMCGTEFVPKATQRWTEFNETTKRNIEHAEWYMSTHSNFVQQTPTAWILKCGEQQELWWEKPPFGDAIPLYTSPPAQRKPLTLWTEAQHERAYRNSPELHKDVKSLAAFKRVAKEIAAMYGIKENT